MAKKLDHLLERLPAKRRAAIEARASGMVYRGFDPGIKRPVALKVIDHLTPGNVPSSGSRGKTVT